MTNHLVLSRRISHDTDFGFAYQSPERSTPAMGDALGMIDTRGLMAMINVAEAAVH